MNGAIGRVSRGREVAMATAGGVTQAVFPRGGLSRKGRLQPPKPGILTGILAGHAERGRDAVFVPVAPDLRPGA